MEPHCTFPAPAPKAQPSPCLKEALPMYLKTTIPAPLTGDRTCMDTTQSMAKKVVTFQEDLPSNRELTKVPDNYKPTVCSKIHETPGFGAECSCTPPEPHNRGMMPTMEYMQSLHPNYANPMSSKMRGELACFDTQAYEAPKRTPHAPPFENYRGMYKLIKEKPCACGPGPCKCGCGMALPYSRMYDASDEEHPPKMPVHEANPVDFYPALLDKEKLGQLKPVVHTTSTARYSWNEWSKQLDDRLHQSLGDLQKSRHVSEVSKISEDETAARTKCTQGDVDRLLCRRVEDMHMTNTDYEALILEMREEVDLLLEVKKRMETALGVISGPEIISGECLYLMTKRLGIDLAKDFVEMELQSERVLIKDVKDLLTRTVGQANDQVGRNRSVKELLEKDWSDKIEAFKIDSRNAALKNDTPYNLFREGVTRFQEWQSTPASLEEFSKRNCSDLLHELNISKNFRALMDRILTESSYDLRLKADKVDSSFSHRIYETEVAKRQLEEEHRKVLINISEKEKLILDLKQAILDKEKPMRLAQSRLYHRTFRPGMELCRDGIQYRLVEEVGEINQAVTELEDRMRQAQESLQQLEETRMDLESDISVKDETLKILHRCLEVRAMYPPAQKLAGY